MRLAVIGCNGIGAAHLVAAARVGYKIVGLYDTAEITSVYYTGEKSAVISNQWGTIDEQVSINYAPVKCQSVKEILELYPDLIIIATPTEFHQDYLNQLKNFENVVLVEKPMGNITTKVPHPKQIYVGYQWVHNPLVANTAITSIHDGHDYPPAIQTQDNLVWDLGCHTLSAVLKEKINLVTNVEIKLKSFLDGVLDTDFVFDYEDKGTTDIKQNVNIKLSYKSPLANADCGLLLNNQIQVRWADMYDMQLMAIEKAINNKFNGPLITFREGLVINQICAKWVEALTVGFSTWQRTHS